jgi:Ca2+-binding EF-hand superfamily protein
MKKTFLSLAILVSVLSCKSTQETSKPETTSQRTSTEQSGRSNPEEMFTKMDTNTDGKLSKEEVKGPLAEKFSEIDTNKDGFISKDELKNAPKPDRQGRPNGVQGQGGQGRR